MSKPAKGEVRWVNDRATARITLKGKEREPAVAKSEVCRTSDGLVARITLKINSCASLLVVASVLFAGCKSEPQLLPTEEIPISYEGQKPKPQPKFIITEFVEAWTDARDINWARRGRKLTTLEPGDRVERCGNWTIRETEVRILGGQHVGICVWVGKNSYKAEGSAP